jgi:DNA-directed RNA polymerase specialized sigma24 family protein
MIPVHNFRESELREKATVAILEMLADLPETQRNIFVWNHYCGYQPKQIAEMLRWSPPEVEAALDATNSMLYQRTRSLLVGSNMRSPVDATREA